MRGFFDLSAMEYMSRIEQRELRLSAEHQISHQHSNIRPARPAALKATDDKCIRYSRQRPGDRLVAGKPHLEAEPCTNEPCRFDARKHAVSEAEIGGHVFSDE